MYDFYLENPITKNELQATLRKLSYVQECNILVVEEVPEDDVLNVDLLVVLENSEGDFKSHIAIYFDQQSLNIPHIEKLTTDISRITQSKTAICVGQDDPFIWEIIDGVNNPRVVLVDDNKMDMGQIEILRDLMPTESIR